MTLFANVGDLHLYNRNLRNTLLLPEASIEILNTLHRELSESTEIQLLNFLGDIQHGIPQGKTALKHIMIWTDAFKRIGELMRPRFENLNIKVIDRNGEDITERIKNGEFYPLFTIKGNHDIDNEVNFTYYHYLVSEKILCEPLYVILDDVIQINYYHYNEADRHIPKAENVQKVIGLYHNPIDYPDMPFWLGNQEDTYQAVNILNEVDIAIVGDIHTPYDPTEITTSNGTKTVIWVQGSLGRTAFAEGQIRDEGIISVLDTNNLTQFGTLKIPLIPKEEYFNYRQAVVEQANRQDLRNFALNVGNIQTTIFDVRDEIRNLENVEQEVKDLAIKYLTDVIESQ